MSKGVRRSGSLGGLLRNTQNGIPPSPGPFSRSPLKTGRDSQRRAIIIITIHCALGWWRTEKRGEGRGRKSPRGIKCSREKRKEHRGGCNTRDSPREELPGNINLEITQSIPLSTLSPPSLTLLFQNMSKLMNFFLNHEMPQQQRTIGSRAGSCQRGVAEGTNL